MSHTKKVEDDLVKRKILEIKKTINAICRVWMDMAMDGECHADKRTVGQAKSTDRHDEPPRPHPIHKLSEESESLGYLLKYLARHEPEKAVEIYAKAMKQVQQGQAK